MTKFGATDVPALVSDTDRLYVKLLQAVPDDGPEAVGVIGNRQECRGHQETHTSVKDHGLGAANASAVLGDPQEAEK